MKFAQWLEELKRLEAGPIELALGSSEVMGGFHFTEVQSTEVRSIDCGSQLHRWSELVIQVVGNSGENSGRPMSVEQLLKIVGQAQRHLGIDAAAGVILEWRPESASAAQRFRVESLRRASEFVHFQTSGLATQCKPAGGGCCDGVDLQVGVGCCG